MKDMKLQVHGLVRVFTEEEIKAAREQGRLLSLDLELTKKCNLKCIYCYADGGKPNADELTLGEIYRTLDEAKNLGAKKVTFTGGEPLIHEYFFNIAEYAYEAGLKISLYTNGTLIDSRAAKKIAELEIFPCVKLDAISASIQDTLAGVEGAFERIMRGINNLMKVGYANQININTVICKVNIENLPELWAWARKNNIQPSFLRLGPKGRARGSNLAVKTSELKELFERLSKIDKQFGEDWEPTTPFCGGGCTKQYISCYVSSQGFVQPCTGVDIHAGNIREESLERILGSSEVFKIARSMEKYIKGACSTCEHLNKCYGCRGLAFYVSGDFTEADPFCWNNPKAL
jgi:radical SAM protein with 4Fe4S-binding SPASM domain